MIDPKKLLEEMQAELKTVDPESPEAVFLTHQINTLAKAICNESFTSSFGPGEFDVVKPVNVTIGSK